MTSLATAQPVDAAQVRLQGVRDDQFVTLATRHDRRRRQFTWSPASATPRAEIKRIVVTKGADTLVLEPERGPAEYAQENWTKPEEPVAGVDASTRRRSRRERPRMLCHVFTERPIYRPEEPVHISGFVRSLSRRRAVLCDARRHDRGDRAGQPGMAACR